MASLSIDWTQGVRNATGTLERVRVGVTWSGNDGKLLGVTLNCFLQDGSTGLEMLTLPVSPDGSDIIEFTGAELPVECACDGHYSVTAVFETVAGDRFKETVHGRIECQCPIVTVEPPEQAVQCVDGKKDVTLRATILSSSPDPVWVYWDLFGNGMYYSPPQQPDSSGVVEYTHAYPPGPHTAKLEISQPPHCPATPVTFTVECPTGHCPTPQAIHVVESDTCADGRRDVTLSVDIDGGPAQTIKWSFGDGDSSPNLDGQTNPTGQVTHSYPAPGQGISSYNVTVTVIGQDSSECTEMLDRTVHVQGCDGDCPRFSGDLKVTPGKCDDQGRRRMHFEPPLIVGGQAQEILYDWGDGTSSQPMPASDGGPHSHRFSGGSHTVTLTAHGPGNCQATISKDIEVDPCDGTPTDGGTTSRGTETEDGGCLKVFCIALLTLALAALAAAGVMAIAGSCTGAAPLVAASAVTAGIGLMFLGIWLLVCGEANCGTLVTLINAFAAFVAILPILALILWFIAPPCALGALLTWGYYGSALALLYFAGRRLGCIETHEERGL